MTSDDLLKKLLQFASKLSLEVVKRAVDGIVQDLEDMESGMDVLADAIPDPDEELRSQVIIAYDVALALRNYQRNQLRTFAKKRYRALWKQWREVMTTDLLRSIVSLLARLEWGAAMQMIIQHSGKIVVGAFAAKELYADLNKELMPRLLKPVLKQSNPRRRVDGPHTTRK